MPRTVRLAGTLDGMPCLKKEGTYSLPSRRALRCINRDREHNPARHLPGIDLATNRALNQLICATFLDRGVEPSDSFASLELLSESNQHQSGLLAAIGVARLSCPLHSSCG